MSLKNILYLTLFFVLVNANVWAAKSIEEGDVKEEETIEADNLKERKAPKNKQSNTTKYVHGSILDIDTLAAQIDNKEQELLHKALVKLYQDAVTRPIKDKIPTYFILGNTGSGKSTTIFALQGNKVEKTESKKKNFRKRANKKNIGLVLKKTVKGDVPEVKLSAQGVTVGCKIYYRDKDKKRTAFCDTEGLSGRRDTKTATEKVFSAFSPWFALKSNRIGGIVLIVSSADIDGKRGEGFATAAAFVQKYFGAGMLKNNRKDLQKSIMLLITKAEGQEESRAEQFAQIIQQSYKDFYQQKLVSSLKQVCKNFKQQIRKKQPKNDAENKKEVDKTLAALQPFFSLFLEKDVPEGQIDDIEKFDLGENVDFFYPYKQESVQQNLEHILELKPVDPKYFAWGDTQVFQYCMGKVLGYAYKIHTKVNKLRYWKGRARVQTELLAEGKEGVDALLDKLNKQIIFHEKKIQAIIDSKESECVFKDKHLSEGFLELLKFKRGSKVGKIGRMAKGALVANTFGFMGVVRGVGSGLVSRLVKGDSFKKGYAWGKGGLCNEFKYFIYDGTDPICKIKVTFEKAEVHWIEPHKDFIEENFGINQSENRNTTTLVFTAKQKKGIKRSKWFLYHVADFFDYANAYVFFYGPKNKLYASELKVQYQEDNIKQIEEHIKYIRRYQEEDKNEDDMTLKLLGAKGMVRDVRKELLKHLQTMGMIYFWAQTIFSDKPSSRELIEQYTQDYEKAMGKKIIDKFRSFGVKSIKEKKVKPIFSSFDEIEIQDEEEQKEAFEDYTFKQESYVPISTDNNNDFDIVD